MKKGQQIVVNLIIFLLIGGFIWHIATSINRNEVLYADRDPATEEVFVSPYEQIASFEVPDEISRFELDDDKLYIIAGATVYICQADGKEIHRFPISPEARDIAVKNRQIYILYPTYIEVFSEDGTQVYGWKACSELSDYCSFTFTDEHVFVTDAANKNICKYTLEGSFVRFIHSPRNFIIPSYAFAIENRNDTIYCVNSGRHQVEMYTPEGSYMGSFGGPGGQSGFFAGCCNPAYIAFSPEGELITSEKGNPRISSFERSGNFKEVYLTARMLGGGNKAYEVKAKENLLYIAGKNKITIYRIKNTVSL